MWQALIDRVVDIVATDHAPHSPDEKRAGEADLSQAPGGFPGVQTMVPLLLDAVAAGRLSWPELVRISSEAPARLFGLQGRKGSLSPGADADVLIVDPNETWTIRNEDQKSRAGITPFAGRRIRGKTMRVLLRGRTIARNGEVEGRPAGRFVGPGGAG
jgi:dihydroorotase